MNPTIQGAIIAPRGPPIKASGEKVSPAMLHLPVFALPAVARGGFNRRKNTKSAREVRASEENESCGAWSWRREC
jgi:hypothetical protein